MAQHANDSWSMDFVSDQPASGQRLTGDDVVRVLEGVASQRGKPQTMRVGLDQAESAILSINQHLAQLARLGMSNFQIEGPTIYCRPSSFKIGVFRAARR